MRYSFTDTEAPERHDLQYFEMFGNRGVYFKGWSAVTKHRTPWMFDEQTVDFDDDAASRPTPGRTGRPSSCWTHPWTYGDRQLPTRSPRLTGPSPIWPRTASTGLPSWWLRVYDRPWRLPGLEARIWLQCRYGMMRSALGGWAARPVGGRGGHSVEDANSPQRDRGAQSSHRSRRPPKHGIGTHSGGSARGRGDLDR